MYAGMGFSKDQTGTLARFGVSSGLFGFSLFAGCFNTGTIRGFFGWCHRAADVGTPVLPTQSVTMILESAGRDAIQMQ
jgi:hypothetical protein